AAFDRKPPKGGLVVNVYTRILDKDAAGEYCRGTCGFAGGDRAAHDHLWLTADECKALVPADPQKGASVPLPGRVAMRLLRFHLVDNTRGEPPAWERHEVRSYSLKLTVSDVTARAVTLTLEGSALLATDANPQKADRGFDVSVLLTL